MNVVLQRAGWWRDGRWRTSWLVTADVDRDGKVRIISGDLDREWHLTVDAPQVRPLLAALASSRVANASPVERDDCAEDILVALHHRFAEDERVGMLEEIKTLLQRHGITYRTEFW